LASFSRFGPIGPSSLRPSPLLYPPQNFLAICVFFPLTPLMHPLQSRRFLILAPASSSLLLRKAGAFFSDRSNSKISGPGIYSAVCLIVILPPPQFRENFHPRSMHALPARPRCGDGRQGNAKRTGSIFP
jgi:hypothetical protein